ncbi:MAG: TonB-dependent receptor [Cytophagales bacterium]|nr:TonB-dependent receptor [Cytophagales bacterium]
MNIKIQKLLMYISRQLLYIFLFQVVAMQLLLANETQGQKLDQIEIDVSINNNTLEEIFSKLTERTGFQFGYNARLVQSKKRYSINTEQKNLYEILYEIAGEAHLQFKRVNNNILVTKIKNPGSIERILIQEDIEITGRVLDAGTGEPLPGATVLVKGVTIGTTTDVDGRFSIDVPEDAEAILVSFVGYESQELSISSKTNFEVLLLPDYRALNEIVVIGYGTQQKKDITGAVGTVKSEDFNRGVINSPGQLLQGKVSGVHVTSSSGAPGAGQRIIVRGQGSIRQSTGPLFVVDGFPLGLAGTGSGQSPMNFINPEDIESIDVLKDASATAIYGARGANGVVIITTKKGKAGVSKIDFSANVGISKMAREIPVFSADEFRRQVVAVGGTLEDRGADTYWQDELTRTAITHDHNLVLQGGSDNFNYRASLGYLDQEGVIINTGYKRYSGRVNATQKLIDGRLNIDFTLNSSIQLGENAKHGTLVSEMLDFNPTYPARDENGDPVKYPDLMNPLIGAELYKDFSEHRRTIINMAPSFEIIKGLVYKLNVGYDNNSIETDNQSMPNADPFEEGRLEQSYFNGRNTLIENYLTYDFSIGTDHDFTLLAGHSYQETYSRWRIWSIDNFPDNDIEPRYNPGLGQELDLVDNHPDGWARINELQSFFGRVNYSYKDKYMVTATVRSDGSSKFGGNNKYGTFPSFAAGWRISEEAFMQSSIISNLKLRAGWGQTGNQEIPNKITQASFTTKISNKDSYPLGGEEPPYTAGTTYVRLANPDLQWEVSTQTNVGLDFELFEGALSGTLDYFHKVSDNILLEVKPPDPIQPATDYWTNVEDMIITNKGLELELDYQYINEDGFSFGLGGNITFIDNVVEDSPFTILTTGSASGSGLTGATINGLINGHPIGSFYMQKFLGIGDDGLSVFEASEDGGRMVTGSALPDKTYNIFANFSYKNFDLNFNFNGVSGNMIYNNTAMNKFYKAKLANSLNTTDKAIEYPEESIINSSSVSTRYLENGSFFRLNNMTLGYNFDTNAIGIGSWAKGLRLSITGQNLFVITDYSGFDPEVNQDRSIDGIQSAGIDLNGYPKARTFIFGLNMSF